MISTELQNCLNFAFSKTMELTHEYVTLEHLLYALIQNSEVRKTLEALGGDLQILRRNLEAHFDTLPEVKYPKTDGKVPTTLAVQRVIQRAAFDVQAAGKNEILPTHVLVALFNEKESYATYFLQKQDITRIDIVSYLSHGIHKLPSANLEEPLPLEEGESSKTSLQGFILNLNERAKRGKIDPLIGRERELDRVVHILCRRRKNNPLLVGDAGVGKTAIVEGLALKIVKKEVPEPIRALTLYALDMGALLAGTKFRGDFELRLKSVLQKLSNDPHAVLFIDEIHTVIGAGATTGGSLDASNLLKPALNAGDLRCIGATTYKEFRNYFEKDHALARRFQKVDINEPSLEETYQIITGLKSQFEKFHNVEYPAEALKSAVDLSSKYLHEKKLPDKAIDVIDEVGAQLRLNATDSTVRQVTVRDIEEMVAKIACVPPRTVSSSDKEQLKNLESNLKLTLFGQEQAIEKVASTLKLSRAGLGNSNRPIGNFLFAGPTGVGKTELAKELARVLGIEFIRFDMSEYMEKHTVSRLIGAPPGYVGFDQGGLLTDAINKMPHAVLLLDEIEKAHPDLFNILLQVMDYGTLTDNNGRKSDFKNVILIMTTNAGAREIQRPSIGIHQTTVYGSPQQEIDRIFSPEFRNRLDATVHFNSLDETAILKVVDKFMARLENQLAEKKVLLTITDTARHYLAQHGYDPKNGARPMEKLIQEKIARPLADEVLFGKLEKGGVVELDCKDDQLDFQYQAKSKKPEEIKA